MTTEQKTAGRWCQLPRILGLALLVTGIGSAMAFLSLNYQGYCFERNGWVSDREKIEAAVALHLGFIGTRANSPASRSAEGRQVIYYANAEEFFKVNPDCCRVGKEFYSEGRHRLDDVDRMFGFVSDFVSIKYLHRYRDDEGVVHKKVSEAHFSVNSCGKAFTL